MRAALAGLMLSVGLVGCTSHPPASQHPLAAQPPPSKAVLHDTWSRGADGKPLGVMVYVPGGEFEMGSTRGARNEQPVHTVILDGFWLDQTEVTNSQFAAFLNERGNQVEGNVAWLDLEDEDSSIELLGASGDTRGEYRPKPGRADHPVVEVTWYGARAYCAWVGARLPTEAEWEYAARGPERRQYPWGDGFDGARLNYCDTRCSQEWADETVDDGHAPTLTPALSLGGRGGSYRDGASWCNAQDMAGNVSEWVADWYGEYRAERQVNPQGPSFRDERVLRGGSWYNVSVFVRSAVRGSLPPDVTYSQVGFRCAVDAQ